MKQVIVVLILAHQRKGGMYFWTYNRETQDLGQRP